MTWNRNRLSGKGNGLRSNRSRVRARLNFLKPLCWRVRLGPGAGTWPPFCSLSTTPAVKNAQHAVPSPPQVAGAVVGAALGTDVYNAGLYLVAQHGDPRDGRLGVGSEGAAQIFSMIRPRSTRTWSLMKPLRPTLQRFEAVRTTPAYCWWGSMVIRERAHLNAAINATNLRRLVASMTGPLHSLLHREALEQQRLGQVKGALSGSPTQRIVSQDSQTMTRTWLGRTRRRFHSNEDQRRSRRCEHLAAPRRLGRVKRSLIRPMNGNR